MENEYDASDLLSPANTPLCLFDHVKLGFSGHITGLPVGSMETARHRLHSIGVLDGKRGRRDPRCIAMKVPITSPVGEVIGEVAAEVYVDHRQGDVAQIMSRSSLSANLVVPLRVLLNAPDLGESLDRKQNFIGETAAQDVEALNLQFTFMDHAVEKTLDTFVNALPPNAEFVGESALLRKAELHHDLRSDDAIQVARSVCHTAMGNMRLGHHDSYRSGKSRDRTPVAHWRATKSGEVVKVYAKTPQLVRVEVDCGNRESVARCCDGERETAPVSGFGAAQLLYAFYPKAALIAGNAISHVQRASAASKSPAAFVDALHPLLQLARRERGAQGYTPNVATADAARQAYDDLICDGICHLRNRRKGTKLREILDALTGPGGPLARGSQGTIYCLTPEFGRAAAELSKTSVENGYDNVPIGFEQEEREEREQE